MNIPPPTSWNEFEDIVNDCFKIRWQTSDLMRYGRQGQRQQGVDIYGPNDLGQPSGIQCKLLEDEISKSDIDEEIAKAELFRPSIDVLYIATTAKRDAKIQEYVRILSFKRCHVGNFAITILFWADLWQDLVKNPMLFKTHYPQLHLQENNIFHRARFSAILDFSYFGPNLYYYIGLILGDLGQFSGENPYQFEYLCKLIERCGALTLNSTDYSVLSDLIKKIWDRAQAYIDGTFEGDWDEANTNMERVADIVRLSQHNLIGRELAVFRLGQYLAGWERVYSADSSLTISDTVKDDLRRLCISVSPTSEMPEKVEALLSNHDSTNLKTAFNIPERIYNRVNDICVDLDMNS